MAIPAWIPEAWSKLSPDNKKQATNFLQFLLSQQGEALPTEVKPKRKLGILADRFISISDDFDEPLEDFKEYM